MLKFNKYTKKKMAINFQFFFTYNVSGYFEKLELISNLRFFFQIEIIINA